MLYRPPVRVSRAALLSRRLGGIAVPILVVTLLGHRGDLVDTPQELVLIALTSVLAIIGLLASLVGLNVVWDRGFRGASDAGRGFLYALIALSPVIYAFYAAATHPQITDVSTDWTDPPPFHAAIALRGGRMNTVAPPSADKIDLQKRAYPDLTTRRFGVGTDQLFGAAKKVVDRNGWKILEETVPKEDGQKGRIEAAARSLVLGSEDDVVIRITPETTGARIDVRSSSRYGTHDLGQNARRIRSFFTSLDAAVTESFGQ